MSNIGAGETLDAWLIKKSEINDINSFLLTNDSEETTEKIKSNYGKHFKYRTLSASEMTFQPLTSYLKGRFDLTLFTSDLSIEPKERDKIMFEDGTMLVISRLLPQKQLGFYVFKKKFPVIMELE